MSNNLPPGVTDAMIEAHFGGGRDDWPFALECSHQSAIDSLADARGVNPSEVHDFDGKTTLFRDSEVKELSSWEVAGGGECEWRCPICDAVNTDAFDQDDFYDDGD